jgi:predicted TIM-barrel fold metal-dependent hydrolase
VPWVTRQPSDIIRNNIRLTVQPIDADNALDELLRVIDVAKSDEILLFSTDYPHWQFDGDAALPTGLPVDLVRKMTIENPLATYGRLHAPAPQQEKAA